MLHALFFCWFLLLPSSTLFPYTTLFRSTRAREDLEQLRVERHDAPPSTTASVTTATRSTVRGCADYRPVLLDRKSTRLNSSHRCISYAVFCLKKKNMVISSLSFTD